MEEERSTYVHWPQHEWGSCLDSGGFDAVLLVVGEWGWKREWW